MKRLFHCILILFLICSFAGAGFAQGLERDGCWLKYNGNHIWLLGYDLQQLFNDASYSENDVKGYIDILASSGVTAFRVWMNTWFLNNPGVDYYPYTYSGGKFDLGTFDSAFFERWKNLLEYAKTKGIIVEIVIFSEYPGTPFLWIESDDRPPVPWQNYWRAEHNNQSYFEDQDGDFFPQFYTLNYTEDNANLTAIQKALMAKAVQEFHPIGNVFFLIANEFPTMGGGNFSTGAYVDQVYTWQEEMADYAKGLGAIVFVHGHEFYGLNIEGVEYWSTRPSVDGMAFHPYSSTVSNANINSIGTLFNPLQNAGRVLIFNESWQYDSDTSAYTKTVVREMFAAFTNGIYYLAYWDNPFTIGEATWIARAGAVTTLANIVKLVDWPQMSRARSAVTAGPGPYWEGMAKSGQSYIFYFTGTPSTTAARFSTLLPGTYHYKYYDTRAWNPDGLGSGQVTSTGGTVNIPAPPAASWDGACGLVLVVTAEKITPPAPEITTLAPPHIIAGSGSFGLQVSGSGFVSGSVVQWDGTARATNFVSDSQLIAAIPATDIAVAGTVAVRVLNPDGAASNSLTFEIRNPVPSIASLSPSSATAGEAGFTLAVNGSNFINGSVVRWNGSDRPTSYGNAAQLTASIGAADIAAAGTASVTVFTPAPGGWTSAAVNFEIKDSMPTLASITLDPSIVISRFGSQGTVTLSGPAPAGNAVVSLYSSNTSVAAVPPAVTVPSRQTSADFAVSTKRVTSNRAVTISASFGKISRSATLTVKPALASVSVTLSSVKGGNSSSAAVNLNAPAPADIVVSLSSSNPSVATIPASVMVSSGQTSADFTVNTAGVTRSRTVTISGSYDGVTKSDTLYVTR